jgi:hypothetical protein
MSDMTEEGYYTNNISLERMSIIGTLIMHYFVKTRISVTRRFRPFVLNTHFGLWC